MRALHLALGLCFGAVFVVLGLTGTAIAWLPEIDAWLNPALLVSAPGAPAQVTPQALQRVVDLLEADPAYGKPQQLVLPQHGYEVYIASYPRAPAPGWGGQAVVRQVMVDAGTLAVKGERDVGRFGLSAPLLMPSLFQLHRTLLAGEAGKLVLAVAALALLALAASGLVLWWPGLRWRALLRSLRLAHGGSWPRFHYSLHRAAGFVAAPLLLLLAGSGLYFSMPGWVRPVVGAVSTVTPVGKLRNAAAGGTPLRAGAALAAARALFPAARPTRIGLPSGAAAPYEIRLRQPGEFAHGDGATRVTLDAVSGQPLRVRDPLRAPAGDRFLGALYPLHSGQAFGAAGRGLISVSGLMPAVFLATGLLMWRKRSRRSGKTP